MTEREYIVISDLAAIRVVESILHDVIAESNPHIDSDEYKTVIGHLRTWRTSMFEDKAITCMGVD